MYEEAEAILTKLPKPVEEDDNPPAESWSPIPFVFLAQPRSCHPTNMERMRDWEKLSYGSKDGETFGVFLLLKQSSIAKDIKEVVTTHLSSS